MGNSGYMVSARNINPIPIPFHSPNRVVVKPKSFKPLCQISKNGASPSKKEPQQLKTSKKNWRARRSLIPLSTSHGNTSADGKWSAKHVISLRDLDLHDLVDDYEEEEEEEDEEEEEEVKVFVNRDLDLHDLVDDYEDGDEEEDSKVNRDLDLHDLVDDYEDEDEEEDIKVNRDLDLHDLVDDYEDEDEEDEEEEEEDAKVFINLSVEEHVSFGFSVYGRIKTSFNSQCRSCFCTYCRKIDTGFRVWVLPLSRRNTREDQLPEIGGDDPSVIYVKRGQEANLDSFVQDTIRLESSFNDTCSDACAKAEPRDIIISEPEEPSAPINDGWTGRLLELKKRLKKSSA